MSSAFFEAFDGTSTPRCLARFRSWATVRSSRLAEASSSRIARRRSATSCETSRQYRGSVTSPMPLDAGTTFAPISINPQDDQFIETRRFNVEENGRMFGIPASCWARPGLPHSIPRRC